MKRLQSISVRSSVCTYLFLYIESSFAEIVGLAQEKRHVQELKEVRAKKKAQKTGATFLESYRFTRQAPPKVAGRCDPLTRAYAGIGKNSFSHTLN